MLRPNFFYGFFKQGVLSRKFKGVFKRIFFLRRFFTAAFKEGSFFRAGLSLISLYSIGLRRRSHADFLLSKTKKIFSKPYFSGRKRLFFKKSFAFSKESERFFKDRLQRSERKFKRIKRTAPKRLLDSYNPVFFAEKFFIPKFLKRSYANRFFRFYFDWSKGIYVENLHKSSFKDVATFFIGKGYFLGKIPFFSFYGRLFHRGWHFKFMKVMLSIRLFSDHFLKRIFYKRRGFFFLPFIFRIYFFFYRPFVVFNAFR
jgi:hypothetical protein